MASDLREKLKEYAREGEANGVDDFALGCARLALESCPCHCENRPNGDVDQCVRCALLASLASKGKGG
jgi:hypothetical protein